MPSGGDIKVYFVAAPAFVLVNQPFTLAIRYLGGGGRQDLNHLMADATLKGLQVNMQ